MVHDALRTRAEISATFARTLQRVDPALGSTTFPLAGGHVVLCGAGTYMNEAQACGLDAPMTAADFERLEAAAASVGVPAAVETAPATQRAIGEGAAARGYVPAGHVSVLRRPLERDTLEPRSDGFVIEPAPSQLDVWQETAAHGWGHIAPAARRSSDVFGAAAAIVDGDGLVLARDGADGRPVACASVNTNGPIAMLGGMSTLPTERRRGAQAALIRYRLQVAHDAGCTLAISTTQPGSDSERNLVRHGFERWFIITKLARNP